jgi:hypothetical protein
MSELNDAEIIEANRIGELTGMGSPDLNDTPDGGEESLSDEPKTDPSKPEAKPGDTPNKPEDGEDGEEDDADGKTDPGKVERKPRAKTVPYETLKAQREENRQMRAELDSLIATVDALKAEKGQDAKAKEEIDEIEKEAEALAAEMGLDNPEMDAKSLAAIIRKTLEIAERRNSGKLPKELEEKKALLDKLEEDQKIQAESASFTNEWNDALPTIKKLFPNAGEAQLAEAKAELDILAHSKDFHTYALEDIVTSPRNLKKFETILKVAPKQKSGETGKTVGAEQDYNANTDDDTLEDIEDMTPEMMKRREEREMSGRDSNPKDYRIQNPIRSR